MPRDLISLDQFRSEFRSGTRPSQPVYRLQPAGSIVVNDAQRTIRMCFSDGTVDRVGDTINPKGWVLDNYLKNNVILWAHDSYAPSIGRGLNLAIENSRLMGDVEFAPPEIYDFADLIYRLMKGGFLHAGSVGFMPLEYSWSNDDGREFGIDFESQELLEYSICPVPANPNALEQARAKGIDTRPLVSWAEKVLDGGGRVILPRSEVEAMRRSAQEPHSRHRGAEDWRCGAARDLSTDPSEDWDGPAAEKSIFEWAGGDDFDPAKAKQGFLVYDAGSPKLRGSYKEPFARVIGGELKATKGGVKAAASRLPQTQAPQHVLDDARAVLDHYEEKMDMKTAPRQRDGMGEGDPAAGGFIATCGRKAEEECGLKNPEECSVHGPLLQDNKAILALLSRQVKGMVGAVLREAVGKPEDHLTHAREHVAAANEHLDDLVMIDPSGDENLAGNLDAHKAICGMHAHVKAADGYCDQYRCLAMGSKGIGALPHLASLPDGEPQDHLKRAREHVEAAHDCMKTLDGLDPTGKDNLFGNEEGQEAIKGMHAHLKAADDYLGKCRAAMDVADDGMPPVRTGDERSAREARLRNLAPAA